MDFIIDRYEEANESNEFDFSYDVDQLVSQIEIYDRIWYIRHMTDDPRQHSNEAKQLINEFIKKLENIPGGCAECFPFELIDELKAEYFW